MNKIDVNKIWIGFLAGLIMPAIAAYVYYLFNFKHLSFNGFINYIKISKTFTPLLSISVLGNLAVFYPYIWKSMWQGAKGVLAATFFWGAVIVVLKFLI